MVAPCITGTTFYGRDCIFEKSRMVEPMAMEFTFPISSRHHWATPTKLPILDQAGPQHTEYYTGGFTERSCQCSWEVCENQHHSTWWITWIRSSRGTCSSNAKVILRSFARAAPGTRSQAGSKSTGLWSPWETCRHTDLRSWQPALEKSRHRHPKSRTAAELCLSRSKRRKTQARYQSLRHFDAPDPKARRG